MAEAPLYFKWTGPNGEACAGGTGVWSLPTDDEPGAWMPAIAGEIIPCERGYHLCRPMDVPAWYGSRLWVAEARGDIVVGRDKVVCREARLVREIPVPTDRLYRLFAADCAEHVVHLTGPDARCVEAIAVARRYADGAATAHELIAARDAAGAATGAAAGAAARDSARAAARASAWAAARDAAGDTAWAAARATAWAAARAAARAAAGAAAWDPAGDAAWDATWDATWDAEHAWQSDLLAAYLTGALA